MNVRAGRVESMTSAQAKFHLGHHRVTLYGDKGCALVKCDVTPRLEGVPWIQLTENSASWTQNRWYYHSDSLVNIVDDCTREWFRVFLTHGTVWTGACDNAVHRSQRLDAKRLKSSDWPRDPLGPSWPSFPSIGEWMEMLRKGIDPFGRSELKEPCGITGYTRVSRSELRENPYLATRIVSNAIVGIRSTSEIPRKFLGFFRYRQNFLILVCRWSIPIGLVRFLLAQWATCPYSLWLRRASTLKQYLRKVPIAHVKHARTRLTSDELCSYGSRNGSCTPTSAYSLD